MRKDAAQSKSTSATNQRQTSRDKHNIHHIRRRRRTPQTINRADFPPEFSDNGKATTTKLRWQTLRDAEQTFDSHANEFNGSPTAEKRAAVTSRRAHEPRTWAPALTVTLGQGSHPRAALDHRVPPRSRGLRRGGKPEADGGVFAHCHENNRGHCFARDSHAESSRSQNGCRK